MKKTLITIFITLIPMLMFAVGLSEKTLSLILTIAAVGIIIVMIALSFVSISVGIMSKTIEVSNNRSSKRVKKFKEAIMSDDQDRAIAIATALHLEMTSRNEEQKAILTLQKVIKPFSGWTNKALGMRTPRFR